MIEKLVDICEVCNNPFKACICVSKNNKFVLDRMPEINRSLDEIEKDNKNLISETEKQLEIIIPSIKDFVDNIKKQKPNFVVFMDKGARILATPLKKYLNDIGIEECPEFVFYNDDELKQKFMNGDSVDKLAEEDFGKFKDKKVFFIDETFSSGTGASSLQKINNVVDFDMSYFALTKDPKVFKDSDLPNSYKKKAEKMIRDIGEDERFKIYENPISILFTKKAAKLYVVDGGGNKTVARYETLKDEEVEDVYNYEGTIHARNFKEVPDNMSWKEYDMKIKKNNFNTLKTIKDKVYQGLSK